jgi:hypothetical protein
MLLLFALGMELLVLIRVAQQHNQQLTLMYFVLAIGLDVQLMQLMMVVLLFLINVRV